MGVGLTIGIVDEDVAVEEDDDEAGTAEDDGSEDAKDDKIKDALRIALMPTLARNFYSKVDSSVSVRNA